MKTFFTATDRLTLERYRVLASYKKQRVWRRRPVMAILPGADLIITPKYYQSFPTQILIPVKIIK